MNRDREVQRSRRDTLHRRGRSRRTIEFVQDESAHMPHTMHATISTMYIHTVTSCTVILRMTASPCLTSCPCCVRNYKIKTWDKLC